MKNEFTVYLIAEDYEIHELKLENKPYRKTYFDNYDGTFKEGLDFFYNKEEAEEELYNRLKIELPKLNKLFKKLEEKFKDKIKNEKKLTPDEIEKYFKKK